MDLGSRLKEMRNNKGITQKELGERLHLSRQSVSKWENNNSLPDIYTLVLLADIYETSVVEILGENNKNLLISETLLEETEKEQVLSFNDKRRREEMLETRTKKFLRVSVLVLFLLVVTMGGKGLYDDHQRKKEDESYKVTLYGISNISYGSKKNVVGVDMEYIKEIKLIDGTVLLNPTFEQIKENKLLEENGEGTKVYKGTIINYYANGSKN